MDHGHGDRVTGLCNIKARVRARLVGLVVWPVLSALVGISGLGPWPSRAAAEGAADPVRVGRQAVLAAMRRCRGYDPAMTTNGARFQAEVVLHLVRDALARDSSGCRLFIGHEPWYRAFLEVTARTDSTAPQYVRLGYAHGQDMVADCRSGRVVRRVNEGPAPEVAANIRIWWPDAPGRGDRFSYLDTLSTPVLKVTNHQVIIYRLLDFGDFVAFDRVEGLTGRPASGLLGLLFKVIGEGRVDWSRMAISGDGLQVNRSSVSKAFFRVTATATVQPNGQAEKGVPDGRPDLRALEKMLKQKIDIDYVPLIRNGFDRPQ